MSTIPTHLQRIVPMLAVTSNNVAARVDDAVNILEATGNYIADLKWDGIRCLAYIENGTVTLINRRLVDITFRYPDVVAALSATYGNKTRVLDGEIIVTNPATGKPDFAAIHRRDAQANVRSVGPLLSSMPATFMAFDVLCYNGDDTRPMPYLARRSLLMRDRDRFLGIDGVDWSQSSEDIRTMWEFVVANGLEGLIAKTKTGPYRLGRQQSWVKLKQTWRITAIAGGYTAGKGRRASGVGAVKMWLLDLDNAPVDIGEVGTGFDDADLDQMKKLLDDSAVVMMEIELQNITAAGKARFPVFHGIRTDSVVTDCTMSQLDGIPVI